MNRAASRAHPCWQIQSASPGYLQPVWSPETLETTCMDLGRLEQKQMWDFLDVGLRPVAIDSRLAHRALARPVAHALDCSTVHYVSNESSNVQFVSALFIAPSYVVVKFSLSESLHRRAVRFRQQRVNGGARYQSDFDDASSKDPCVRLALMEKRRFSWYSAGLEVRVLWPVGSLIVLSRIWAGIRQMGPPSYHRPLFSRSRQSAARST